MQDKLVSQSEFIIKEAVARFKRPVLLWAGGKDSVLGNSKIYYKINGNLHYGTIEELYKRAKAHNTVKKDKKTIKIPSDKVEVLSVEGIDQKNSEPAFKKVNALIKHSTTKQIYEFETFTGRKICTTGDHSLIKYEGLQRLGIVEAKKLKNGDSLFGVTDYNFEGKRQKVPSWLLALAGLWVADGCYAVNRKIVLSTGKNKEILSFLKDIPRSLRTTEKGRKLYEKLDFKNKSQAKREIAKRLMCSEHTIHDAIWKYSRLKEKADNLYLSVKKNGDVWIHSKPLVQRMKKLGFKGKCREKRIPDWLFIAERRQIGLFLGGLFSGDGSISRRGIILSGVNEELLKDTRELLWRLGIEHGFSATHSKWGYKPHTFYRILICRKDSVLKFKKQVPLIKGSKKLDQLVKSLEKIKKMQYSLTAKKIKSIKKLPIKERVVYDLDVEGTNRFVANNLVAHNSTAMLSISRMVFSKLGGIPFPVMQIDTGYKFTETYQYMDKYAKEWNLDFIRYKNTKALKEGINPHTTNHFECCNRLKTEALSMALKEYGFDGVMVGIRWDEHGVRGKESFFSKRPNPDHTRVHPMLNWSEKNIWDFLKKHKIPYNPLYDRIEHGNLVFRSIGCLPPGQKIVMEKSLKPIDEIKLGDKVRGIKGNYTKVTKLYKRRYNGKIIGIRTMYDNRVIWVTPEHPVYVIKTEKCPNPKKGMCRPSCTSRCYKYHKKYKAEWVPAGKLKAGDISLYPLEKNKSTWKGDCDFFRLVGYYLAEGYINIDNTRKTNRPSALVFSFNKKERGYINDVKSLMKKWYGSNCYSRVRNNVNELTFVCAKAAREFLQFGKGARNKKIPLWVVSSHDKCLIELLKGMYRGDGSIEKLSDKRYKKLNNVVIKYVTVSESMAESLRLILMKFNLIPSLSKIKVGGSEINGRTIKASGPAFKIRITGKEQISKFSSILGIKLKHNSKTNRRHGYFENGFLAVPITKIKRKDYNGYVYNLEVQRQESYNSALLTLHNCWPCTKPIPKENQEERGGRALDKEQLMEDLRALGYM